MSATLKEKKPRESKASKRRHRIEQLRKALAACDRAFFGLDLSPMEGADKLAQWCGLECRDLKIGKIAQTVCTYWLKEQHTSKRSDRLDFDAKEWDAMYRWLRSHDPAKSLTGDGHGMLDLQLDTIASIEARMRLDGVATSRHGAAEALSFYGVKSLDLNKPKILKTEGSR